MILHSITDRITYRYERHKARYEDHYETLEKALDRAVRDIQDCFALPVEIRRGRRVLLDKDRIVDAWELKYLQDTQPAS
jgi:hypothetical protein